MRSGTIATVQRRPVTDRRCVILTVSLDGQTEWGDSSWSTGSCVKDGSGRIHTEGTISATRFDLDYRRKHPGLQT